MSRGLGKNPEETGISLSFGGNLLFGHGGEERKGKRSWLTGGAMMSVGEGSGPGHQREEMGRGEMDWAAGSQWAAGAGFQGEGFFFSFYSFLFHFIL